MLQGGGPFAVSQAHQAESGLCVDQGSVESERALCCRFGDAGQRRLVFAAKTQVADREQRHSARKAALLANQRFEPFDRRRADRRGNLRKTLASAAEEFLRAAHKRLVSSAVLGADETAP